MVYVARYQPCRADQPSDSAVWPRSPIAMTGTDKFEPKSRNVAWSSGLIWRAVKWSCAAIRLQVAKDSPRSGWAVTC